MTHCRTMVMDVFRTFTFMFINFSCLHIVVVTHSKFGTESSKCQRFYDLGVTQSPSHRTKECGLCLGQFSLARHDDNPRGRFVKALEPSGNVIVL